MFTRKLTGDPIGPPWEDTGPDGSSDDWEFTTAVDDKPEELYALWDDAVARSHARLDAVLAKGGLDQPAHVAGTDGQHANVRRLVCDLIEEYGRHTGHADLLREAVDGVVGEDPPAGWRPVIGRPPWNTDEPLTPSRPSIRQFSRRRRWRTTKLAAGGLGAVSRGPSGERRAVGARRRAGSRTPSCRADNRPDHRVELCAPAQPAMPDLDGRVLSDGLAGLRCKADPGRARIGDRVGTGAGRTARCARRVRRRGAGPRGPRWRQARGRRAAELQLVEVLQGSRVDQAAVDRMPVTNGRGTPSAACQRRERCRASAGRRRQLAFDRRQHARRGLESSLQVDDPAVEPVGDRVLVQQLHGGAVIPALNRFGAWISQMSQSPVTVPSTGTPLRCAALTHCVGGTDTVSCR